MGLFGLLEVVADAARVDAEQTDLAGLLRAGRVAGRRVQLGLEILRQPEADRLLRITAGSVGETARVDGVSKSGGYLHPRRVLIADLWRDRMPDARERAEAGQE